MSWNPNATVTIGGDDFTGETLAGLAIHYGRPSIWEQARAGYCTVSILNLTNTDYAFEINENVVITIEDSDGTDITVFTGKVTEISNEVAASGSSATVAVQTITAVAAFAQMSRVIVGTTNYPKEYDDERIDRILTEAGVTIDVVDTPGVYELVERQAEPIDAYTLATYYAGMCFGYLYETADGKVGYANESRRTIDVDTSGYLDIDEGYINWRGINSRKSISDIVNKVILFYKNNDQVTSDDATSIANYGLIEARIDTELHNLDEAQNIADRYVSLRSIPETNFSSFNINLDNPNLLAADLDDLIAIQMGTAIQIDNLPNPISAITYTGFVEGWDLVINQTQALLTITSSDSTYSVVPIRWQDVDPTIQWEDINPTATRTTKTNLVYNPSFEPINYGALGYIYTPGVGTYGSYGFTTPDAAALDITGDIDIRVKIAPDDWTPSSTQSFIGKDISANRSYFITLNTAGTLSLFFTANGTTTLSATSSANLSALANEQVKWIRTTLDVDNGSGGRTARFYTSDDGTSWTELGVAQTAAGTTSIYSGTAPLTLGYNTNSGQFFKGKIYAASIRDGIDGTEVFGFDVGGNWKSSDVNSFTATTGQTVTLTNLMQSYGWVTSLPATDYSITRDTTTSYSGNTCAKMTINIVGSPMYLYQPPYSSPNVRIPVSQGDTFYIQFYAKRGTGSRNASVRLFTFNTVTSTTVIESFTGSTVTLNSSTWTKVQLSGTITNANSLYASIWVELRSNGSVGDSIYVDSIICEKNSGGYAAYYFDGSYSDIPANRVPTLAWTGTAQQSSSTAEAYWTTLPTTTWANVDSAGLP